MFIYPHGSCNDNYKLLILEPFKLQCHLPCAACIAACIRLLPTYLRPVTAAFTAFVFRAEATDIYLPLYSERTILPKRKRDPGRLRLQTHSVRPPARSSPCEHTLSPQPPLAPHLLPTSTRVHDLHVTGPPEGLACSVLASALPRICAAAPAGSPQNIRSPRNLLRRDLRRGCL